MNLCVCMHTHKCVWITHKCVWIRVCVCIQSFVRMQINCYCLKLHMYLTTNRPPPTYKAPILLGRAQRPFKYHGGLVGVKLDPGKNGKANASAANTKHQGTTNTRAHTNKEIFVLSIVPRWLHLQSKSGQHCEIKLNIYLFACSLYRHTLTRTNACVEHAHAQHLHTGIDVFG